ncbi:MAG: anti-sigma factor [Gemmatimonadales bacterium]
MSDTPGNPAHDLVEEYALGMLDDAQRTAFEASLRADPALRAALAVTVETLGSLAFSTPAAPTSELKARVMARIADMDRPVRVTPGDRVARRSRTPIWLGAALAASLVVVAKLSVDLQRARHDGQAAELAVDAGTRALAQRDSLIAQLTDPGVELVTMAATGAARPAIKAYLNRARRRMFLSAASLEPPPAGQAYQLWFIVDGKAVPSVTFKPDSSGRALLRDVAMPAGEVSATAITREPEGGSTTPTPPILFVGKPAAE